MNVQHRVMALLSGASELSPVADAVLEAITAALRFEASILWSWQSESGTWKALATHAPEMDVAPETLLAASALPERPSFSVEAQTVAARANPFRWQGSHLVPITNGVDTVFGALELFLRHPFPPAADIADICFTVSLQLGLFLERAASESALRRERDNLRALFAQAPAAVALLSASDLRYELSNPMNQRIAGNRPLVGRTVTEALPELEGQGLVALLRQVQQTGEPFIGNEVPIDLTDADGTRHQLFLNGVYQPLFDEHGAVNRIMAFAYDVTGQVRARQAVEDAQRSLAVIADSAPQIIWTTTADGKNEFFNRRWYEYTGLPPDAPPERAWEDFIHPDDAASSAQAWGRAISEGTPFEMQLRLRRASDQTYRWHLARTVPVRNAKGEIVQWIGTSTDIEDQTRAAQRTEALAEATKLLSRSLDYAETLQTVASVIVPRIADACGVYLRDADDALELTAFTHADPSRAALARELADSETSDDGAFGLGRVVRQGRPELLPVLSERRSVPNEEQHGLVTALGARSAMLVPLVAHGTAVGGMVLVSTQPTRQYTQDDLAFAMELGSRVAYAVENAQLYRSAQEAIRARDEFLSIASHELRTPLTPLQLTVQSIQRMVRNDAAPIVADSRMNARLEVVAKQVARLDSLISNLLDVSRVTNDRLELELEELDLGQLAAEVVERFDEQAKTLRTPLIYDGGSQVLGLWDRARLDQVLVNLVSNALKFGEGRPITVRVRADATHAEVQVEDQGIGIAPDDQERIFGRFERAVSARHYGGLGLGLWLTQQIVQALGGTIQVRSKPNEGSTFTVNLPLRPAPAETAVPA